MRLSKTLNRFEVSVGFFFLVLQLFFFPSIIALISDNLAAPLTPLQQNLVFFAANFLCALAIFHRFLWSNLLGIKSRFGRLLRYALWGFGLYYVSNVALSFVIAAVNPGFSNVNDNSVLAMVQESPVLMGICTVFLVPATEEMLHRGLVFGSLQRINRFLAYTVSTLLFSLIHVMGYIGHYETGILLTCFVQYLPAGIVLSWAYEKSDNIFCPILIHMTINQISLTLMR